MAVQTYQWQNTRRDAFKVERWTWSMRGWSLVAIILAVLFHWWLYRVFDNVEINKALASQTPPPVRDRIAINPEAIKDKPAVQNIPDVIAPSDTPPEMQTKADLQDILPMLPDDRALDLTPDVNKITNFLAPDSNPNAAVPAQSPSLAAIADSMADTEIASAADAIKSTTLAKAVSPDQLVLPGIPLDKQMEGVDGELLDKLNQASKAGNAAAAKERGFSNLDDLINRGGNVNASTAPILMPTDLLFEYGSDQLAEGARLSLMKLGLLIQRNPNNRFIVEGHTDTIGTDDFNLELSRRRAKAVVDWLIQSLRLETNRVIAIGLGESHPLPGVPLNGTPEQQAKNRRVEIKIRPLR